MKKPKVCILLEDDEENFAVEDCNSKLFASDESARSMFDQLIDILHSTVMEDDCEKNQKT